MYELYNQIERVKFIREAGEVRRLHTCRTIVEYNVANHTFNMLAMLRLLWPEAPNELIWSILDHDLPERLSGDIPSPAIDRVGNPMWIWELEVEVLQKLFTHSSWAYYDEHSNPAGLPLHLQKWVKALDILELWMFCMDEVRLGNHRIMQVKHRCEEIIERRFDTFPEPVQKLFNEALKDDWSPLPDLGVKR